MVKNSGSFTGSGLRDWLWQRFTALFLLGYFIYLGVWWRIHTPLDHEALSSLFFDSFWFSAATFIALVSILIHAWIGIWTVITDYVKKPLFRFTLLALLLIILLGELFWGVVFLWL